MTDIVLARTFSSLFPYSDDILNAEKHRSMDAKSTDNIPVIRTKIMLTFNQYEATLQIK